MVYIVSKLTIISIKDGIENGSFQYRTKVAKIRLEEIIEDVISNSALDFADVYSNTIRRRVAALFFNILIKSMCLTISCKRDMFVVFMIITFSYLFRLSILLF